MSDVRAMRAVAVAAICVCAGGAWGQVEFEDQSPLYVAIFNDPVGKGFCAEMDGQSGPDIVVPSNGDNELVILLNDGAGEFVDGQFLGVPGSLRAACPGDWDNDGRMDILTVGQGANDRLFFVRQIDDAQWDDVELLSLPGAPVSMACADFNSDGLIDIAVGDADNTNIDVYLNDGSGGLSGLTADSYSMGDVHAITTCDLDVDGRPDLLAVNRSGDMLHIRYNTGGGSFGSQTSFLVGSSPSDVDCCDLNGDGYPDIVVPNEGDVTVTVLLNNTTGGFISIGALPAGTDPISTACGDFDCDGDVDIAVLHKNTTSMGDPSVLLNDDGSGTSWTLDENVVSWNTGAVQHILACELNGEPGTDLVVLENTPLAAVRRLFNVKDDCGNCIAPPTEPIAWYTGDLCTPDDLLGNNDAMYVGLAFCPAASIVGVGALGFEGLPTPVYMEVDDPCGLDPGSGDYSANVWIRTSSPQSQTIINKGTSPGFSLDVAGGRLRLVVCDSTFCWNVTGSSVINDGNWHHVAFTIDRGAMTIMRVWVDGLLERTVSAAVGPISSSFPFYVGAGSPPSPSVFFTGELDELQIHDRALEVEEIQTIYLAGLAGMCRDVCALPEDKVAGLDLYTYEGGAEDDFGGGIDPAVPGPELLALCTGTVDFDVTPSGGSLCHTFPSLPKPITHATLEIRMQGGSAVACDDSISLLATGGAPAFEWQRNLGDPGCAKEPGLLDCVWEAPRVHTFCLDLNALPNADGSTQSIIAAMNTAARLDVRVAEDTMVDFMRLRIAVDQCPGDVTGDGETDLFDLLELLDGWGSCPTPCPPCTADVNGDCEINLFDLLLMLDAWGPC